MRRWLTLASCLVASCKGYELVQPLASPSDLNVYVQTEHDSVTVTRVSIVIYPGIDETGDFRRIPLEPSTVDGVALPATLASGGRLVFYALVDSSALMAAPRMLSVTVPALATPRFGATFRMPIVTPADSGRATLRGNEDLRLRLAFPPDMAGVENAGWQLSLRATSCNSGPSMLHMDGRGTPPAELRISRDLIDPRGATSFVACLRLFLGRGERTETVSTSLATFVSVTWRVRVEP